VKPFCSSEIIFSLHPRFFLGPFFCPCFFAERGGGFFGGFWGGCAHQVHLFSPTLYVIRAALLWQLGCRVDELRDESPRKPPPNFPPSTPPTFFIASVAGGVILIEERTLTVLPGSLGFPSAGERVPGLKISKGGPNATRPNRLAAGHLSLSWSSVDSFPFYPRLSLLWRSFFWCFTDPAVCRAWLRRYFCVIIQ